MKKLFYLCLSAFTIGAPLAVNFSVPQNSKREVVQNVEDMDLPAFDHNKNTKQFVELENEEFKNLEIKQKNIDQFNQEIIVTFESSEPSIQFEVTPYTPKHKPNGGISVASESETRLLNTEVVGLEHKLIIDAQYTSHWKMKSSIGSIYTVNDMDLFSPTVKYQLTKSENNNNREKEEVGEYLDSIDRGLYPTISGELDLVIDFRSPEFHNNEHITNINHVAPKEHYNMWNWFEGDQITLDMSNQNNGIDVIVADDEEILQQSQEGFEEDELRTAEVIEIKYPETITLQRGENITTGKVNEYDYEFVIDENGYTYFKVFNVIDVKEDQSVIKKVEHLDGVKLINDYRTFEVNEGTVTNNNGNWFTIRDSSEASEFFIFHERGRTYYKFNYLNPFQTSLIILSLIWLPIVVIKVINFINKKEAF